MTPEEWAENVLNQEMDYYYINSGEKMEKLSRKGYEDKTFHNMLWSDRDYMYVDRNGKFVIGSCFLINDYSSYLKEIEEL